MGLQKKLFNKDFTMVVIGQIISIFGNNILRFALPLYLYDLTNSPALFGTVSACSFIPMILLSPIGGILADRTNKRNIMVILDFSTCFIVLVFLLLMNLVNLVVLLLVTLIILFAIQGAYQPAVQASVPALVPADKIIKANAVTSLVNSVATLAGPVIGGLLYSGFGIKPILFISAGCFLCSAVMEIFITIPYVKPESTGSVIQIAKADLSESFRYMKYTQPKLWQVCVIMACLNFLLSSLVIIGLPVVIKSALDFDKKQANVLYGYAQGALALGGLTGGILSGFISKKFNADKSHIFLFLSAIGLLPISLALGFHINNYIAYAVIIICCFLIMVVVTLFSIQMMGYLQIITPAKLMGKIISCAMCVTMCASPLGQAVYGGLFEIFENKLQFIFLSVSIICLAVSAVSIRIFKGMDKIVDTAQKLNLNISTQQIDKAV